MRQNFYFAAFFTAFAMCLFSPFMRSDFGRQNSFARKIPFSGRRFLTLKVS